MRSLAFWRVVFVAAGVASIGVGAVLVLDRLSHALVSLAAWSVGPVLVHDGLVAPAVVAGAWLGARLLPRAVWAPLVTGVLLTAALLGLAWALLTRPGALATNPSLLDRDYVAGLLVAMGLLWAGVALWCAAAVARDRRRGPARSPPPG